MADTYLPGFESVWGANKVMVMDHYGPASYATGGETWTLSGLNWGGVLMFNAMGEDFSGTYFMRIIPQNTPAGVPFTTVKIQWFVVSTGAEVANATNLSTFAVRSILIGV